jgi:signal transduction histidine kinase
MYEAQQKSLYGHIVNICFLDHLNTLNGSAYLLLEDDKVWFANQHFIDITGLARDDLIGKPFSGLFGNGRESENIWSAIAKGSSMDNVPLVIENNGIKYFDLKGKVFEADNGHFSILSVSPSNNKPDNIFTNGHIYQYVLESISENIILIDPFGKIHQIIKLKDRNQVNADNLEDLFSIYALKQIKNYISKCPAETTRFFELQNSRSTYEARLVPYSSDKYVFSFNEITLRKRIENKLIDSQLKLRELNKEKDLLMSIIAHDLKNPFNIINGFCSVLLNSGKKFSEEKKEEIIKHIYTASISGNALLENLLEWAKTQSERIIYAPQQIDIYEVTDLIIHFYAVNIINKKLIIDNTIKPNTMVYADKNMLSTVLRNLVSNAIKFTPEHGTITLASKVKKNNVIEVTIKDSGIGLSETQKSNLFKVGKNFTSQGTQGEKGTGLGLLLCKEFIEKQKGSIRVESEKGTGSKFIFSLPLSP